MTVVMRQSMIDNLFHGTGGPIGKFLYNTGLKVQSRAKENCPVDTGRLRSSIATSKPTSSSADTLTVKIGTNVNYARYVELGTRYMRARPFLRKALEQELG